MGDEGDLRQQILQQSLQEVKGSGSTVEPCVICLEPISEGATAQPCRHHNFDYICLLNWLEQQTSCPLCKATIREIQYVGHTGNACVYKVPHQRNPTSKHVHDTNGSFWRGQRASAIRDRRPGRRRRSFDIASSHGEALNRRRSVYAGQLYSLYIGSNRVSAYQDLTPQRFSTTPALLQRARTWIRRELEVFTFLGTDTATTDISSEPSLRNISNAFFLLEYIVAILKTIDIKASSGQAQDMLSDYLGRQNAQLFLHELENFLRSPYETLEAWDRHVQYPTGLPLAEQGASEVERPIRARESWGPRSGPSSRQSRETNNRKTRDRNAKRRRLDRYIPD